MAMENRPFISDVPMKTSIQFVDFPASHVADDTGGCISQYNSIRKTIMFLWCSHGFPMVLLWFSYGFPIIFLWFSYGFPMVFPWFSQLWSRQSSRKRSAAKAVSAAAPCKMPSREMLTWRWQHGDVLTKSQLDLCSDHHRNTIGKP